VGNDTVRELLAKALKRREELRIESEALDRMIATYSSLMHLHRREEEPPQLTLWNGQKSRRAKSAYVAELLAEVRRMIVSEGRPLNRGELVRRLEAAGYLIEGGDKAKVLGTNIWRSEAFVHIEGLGYWPRDVERPVGRS
jgi:hypothetical protein